MTGQPHTFTRLHIPSGREWVGEFNTSHDSFFTDPKSVPQRTLDKIKANLIAEWNWQQPTEWKYWL